MAMTPPDMERDEQLSALYRAAADAVPPPQLDDALRAAARREAGSRPRPASLLSRWRLPLSLAAVVVLSVSLVTLMREEGVDRLDAPAVAPPPQSPPPAALMQENANKAVQEAGQEAGQEAPRPAPPARPAPRPAAEAPAAPAEAAARREVVAPAAVRDEAPPAVQPPPASPADALRPMMRSAPAPAAARSAESPAMAGQSAVMAVPSPWQDLAGRPAGQWLQRIAELRQAGRTAEADAVAAEFRRRFPDQPAP